MADTPARSQPEVVIQGIKTMLTTGELKAGDRLPVENDLAAQLGVSRGSLREGVRALAILGVLDTRQGDGTYVTSLDPSVLLSPIGLLADLQTEGSEAHLLDVRRILEAESAARAAQHLTPEALLALGRVLDSVDEMLAEDADLERFIETDAAFHRGIAQASGNPALAALIDSLGGQTFRARLWRAINDRGSLADTQQEHRAILAELIRGDPERARIRMSVHILGVEEFAVSHPPTPDDEATHSG